MTKSVGWGVGKRESALERVPSRFREMAKREVESIALSVRIRNQSSPIVDMMVNTAIDTTLAALGFYRWYLLYKPERAAAAEAAWQSGNAESLTLFMHELHLSERPLLVAGQGTAKTGEIYSRLDVLHRQYQFTMAAVTEGPCAAAVSAWAKQNNVHCHLFSSSGFSSSSPIENVRNQFYYLIDMLEPKALAVLANDHMALQLAYCAKLKGVDAVDLPVTEKQCFTASHWGGSEQAAPEPGIGTRPAYASPPPGSPSAPSKKFEFSKLISGAKQADTPEP